MHAGSDARPEAIIIVSAQAAILLLQSNFG